MDTKRFDLLLKYILAAAGQEDPGHRELGPIHLIKYLYLADLIFAEKHGGETYTGALWRFHHFGPWSPEVYSRIEPVINRSRGPGETDPVVKGGRVSKNGKEGEK